MTYDRKDKYHILSYNQIQIPMLDRFALFRLSILPILQVNLNKQTLNSQLRNEEDTKADTGQRNLKG